MHLQEEKADGILSQSVLSFAFVLHSGWLVKNWNSIFTWIIFHISQVYHTISITCREKRTPFCVLNTGKKGQLSILKYVSKEGIDYSTVLLLILSLLDGISDWRPNTESASATRSPSVATARSLPSEVLLTLLILLAMLLHLFFFLLSLR